MDDKASTSIEALAERIFVGVASKTWPETSRFREDELVEIGMDCFKLAKAFQKALALQNQSLIPPSVFLPRHDHDHGVPCIPECTACGDE